MSKISVFCVLAPCSLVNFTDVSKVLAAFIVRAFLSDNTVQGSEGNHRENLKSPKQMSM